jgi:hypothetical protein
MRNHTRSTSKVAEEAPSVSIDVEVRGRWGALALAEVLIPYHSFLVQHDGERWVVHARVPGCHNESLEDALGALENWCAEQGSSRTPCWIDGKRYQLGVRERT